MLPSHFLRYVELRAEREHDARVFPFTVPAVRNMGRLNFHDAVTFFVGENGSGKSTLLEAIAAKAGFQPSGGSKNFFAPHHRSESELHEQLLLVRGANRERSGFFLRAETMYNIATEAEAFREYGWEPLHEMSHGEGFLWVFMNRFRNRGLYILDEPEAALSPQKQLSFLTRLHELVGGGCQFIISTHSPIIMAYPRALIYCLDDRGITETDYVETEHYHVTRSFLQDPQRMLKELFRGSDDDE